MNERSVQVIISGQGEHQVRLRVQSAASERSLAVHVGSSSPPGPLRFGAPFGAPRVSTTPAPALLLELRWSEQAPAPIAPPPRSEPLPLAVAWATAQRRRKRQA